MTLGAAVETYLADCERRGLRKSTLGGKRQAFKALLNDLDGDLGLAALARSDIRSFALGLSARMKPGSAIAVLRHVRALLRFCVSEGWLERSPMKGVAMPKDDRAATQPLSRDEVRALLRTARDPRDKALLMLMRWSGLAIGDAVTLRADDIRHGAVITHRRKTGALVAVPLPIQVEAALAALPANGGLWFWSGKSEPVTAAKTWRDRLKIVAAKAGVEGFHPHRLRDTFAVELLLDGVSIEDVSRLLGHSTVTITEKYYAPWNRARLARLEGVVRSAHGRDSVLPEVA